MGAVDLSKVVVGDEITIRCRAHERLADGWRVRALHDKFSGTVLAEHIVSHAPKALEVGDRVKVPGYWGRVFSVRAIDDGFAWLKDANSDGSHIQWTTRDLERVS